MKTNASPFRQAGSVTFKNNLLLAIAIFIPGVAAQPVITGIQNNYSYLLPNTPNYAFAQGGIIVLYGSNLGPAGLLSASFNPALGKTLGGVSIRIAMGSVTTDAIPYYVSPGQISAILPSATPIGNGSVTVTYNGSTSPAFAIQVVRSAFGLMTMSGNGLGQAVVMDTNFTLLGPLTPAKPGQTVILWGTGLGPDPNDETRIISAPANLSNLPFEFYIGNKPADVLYHGRSQFPGLDQLVVRVPEGVEGCYVSTYAKTGNYISNFPTIPVTSGGPCSEFFVSAELLSSLYPKPTVTAGFLYLGKFITYQPSFTVGGTTIPASTTVTNAANAQFLRYKPFDYTNYGSISQPSVGNCVVSGFNLRDPFTAPIQQYLDPGAITLTLADGSVRTLVKDQRSFVLSGGGGGGPLFIPDSSGTLTFRGSGGADVGAFSSPVAVAPPFTWTNRQSVQSVSRQQNLEITWSGGDPNSYVVVTGNSTDTTTVVTTFACTALVGAGRLVVPRDVLASMVPSGVIPGSPMPTGQFIVFNYRFPAKFTAPGIDNGNITYYTGDVVTLAYQ